MFLDREISVRNLYCHLFTRAKCTNYSIRRFDVLRTLRIIVTSPYEFDAGQRALLTILLASLLFSSNAVLASHQEDGFMAASGAFGSPSPGEPIHGIKMTEDGRYLAVSACCPSAWDIIDLEEGNTILSGYGSTYPREGHDGIALNNNLEDSIGLQILVSEYEIDEDSGNYTSTILYYRYGETSSVQSFQLPNNERPKFGFSGNGEFYVVASYHRNPHANTGDDSLSYVRLFNKDSNIPLWTSNPIEGEVSWEPSISFDGSSFVVHVSDYDCVTSHGSTQCDATQRILFFDYLSKTPLWEYEAGFDKAVAPKISSDGELVATAFSLTQTSPVMLFDALGGDPISTFDLSSLAIGCEDSAFRHEPLNLEMSVDGKISVSTRDSLVLFTPDVGENSNMSYPNMSYPNMVYYFDECDWYNANIYTLEGGHSMSSDGRFIVTDCHHCGPEHQDHFPGLHNALFFDTRSAEGFSQPTGMVTPSSLLMRSAISSDGGTVALSEGVIFDTGHGDADLDGIEDYDDNDDDNDTLLDSEEEAAGTDPKDPDTDDDGFSDGVDRFPRDPTEWVDSDEDGYGDNADAFSDDPLEWADSDGDNIGDNSDVCPNTNPTIGAATLTALSRTAGEANTRVLTLNDGTNTVDFTIDASLTTSTSTKIAFGNAISNSNQFAANIAAAVEAANLAGTLNMAVAVSSAYVALTQNETYTHCRSILRCQWL